MSPLVTSFLYVGMTILVTLGLGWLSSRFAVVQSLYARHLEYIAKGEALLADDKRKAMEKAEKAKALAKERRRKAKAASPGNDSDSEAEEEALLADPDDEEAVFAELDQWDLRQDLFVGVRAYPTFLENVRARLRRLQLIAKSVFSVLLEKEVVASLYLGVSSLDRRYFAAAMALTLASSVTQIFLINSTGQLLNIIKDAALGQSDAPSRAASTLGYMFGLTTLSCVVDALRSYCFMMAETKAFTDVQRRYHRNILVQDAAFYKAQGGGTLQYWVSGDVSELRHLVTSTPPRLLRALTDLLVGSAVCLYQDWTVLLVLFLIRIPEAAGLTAYQSRVSQAYSRLLTEDSRKSNTFMRDSVANVLSVQNMAAEEYEVQRVSKLEQDMKVISSFQLYPSTLFQITTSFVTSLEQFVRTVLLANAVLSGRFTVGDYVTYTSFYQKVSGGLEGLTSFLLQLREKSIMLKRFHFLRLRRNANGVVLRRFGEKETAAGSGEGAVAAAVAAAVDGSPGVTPSLLGGWEGAGSSGGSYGGAALMGGGGGSGSSVGAGAVAEDTPPMAIVLDDNGNPIMHTLQGAIEFKDVVFDYPKGDKDDKDITSRSRKRKAAAVRSSEDGSSSSSSSSSGPKTPVLNGFSFRVEPGQRVGIVGPSGGGKSTLLRLISCHYRPTSGSLLIDGIDSSCFSARHLRRCIGYVEQKPVLMSERSVYENIVYGMKEPWPSMERVEAASRDAAIHDTIVGKWAEEGGYEAKIGMDGLDPSGGEQQRLVIARALVRRPSLLLLDESTSSLDAPSEKLVTDAMEKAMRGRTTIMIAHRLCTTQHCDKIIFMKDGRVQEEGTHLELMAKRGDYYAYIQPQIIQSS